MTDSAPEPTSAYPANQASWLVRLSKQVLGSDRTMKYAGSKPLTILPTPLRHNSTNHMGLLWISAKRIT